MGCLGMAIWSLYQALEMGVLLLGLLTGSKSCLLGARPAAAPLPRREMCHLGQYDSKTNRVALMPAATLHWRNQCEDNGPQCPEEGNENLLCSC